LRRNSAAGLLTETRRLGQRKAAYEKIIQGFLLLLGIILIIWAPLLIVSFSRVTSVPVRGSIDCCAIFWRLIGSLPCSGCGVL
jgi:hypothetical protein